VEGIKHRSKPVIAVQFHPEASPGPNDSIALFKKFKDLIINSRLVDNGKIERKKKGTIINRNENSNRREEEKFRGMK
jgi:carbamoyl-phosphate synthase small subunit